MLLRRSGRLASANLLSLSCFSLALCHHVLSDHGLSPLGCHTSFLLQALYTCCPLLADCPSARCHVPKNPLVPSKLLTLPIRKGLTSHLRHRMPCPLPLPYFLSSQHLTAAVFMFFLPPFLINSHAPTQASEDKISPTSYPDKAI